MKKTVLLLFLFLNLKVCLAQSYIFYLHGRIIENQGPNAVEKVNGYGAYLYYDILDSLKQKKFTVISEVRPVNTDVKVYALKVKNQIDSLLKRGIKAENITVIGASKGSYIAMYVSTYAKNKALNFVFMAACGDQVSESEKDIDFYGNILSIYEKSDGPGSCMALKKQSKGIQHFKEVELTTGLKHGFLYKPLKVWVQPALNWADHKYD